MTRFDGIKLPFDDKSFDFCMLIDVLHHTDFQMELLKESFRVASKFVIIKDHYCENKFDRTILQFMDWVGNKAYGVNLPYNYLSTKQWSSLYESLGIKQTKLVSSLGLYPFPASMIFEANLHFITRLDVF